MNERKGLSKFGKVWIIVCAAAVVLGLLLAYAGPISEGMNRYNSHEHAEWCYEGDWTDLRELDCTFVHYDNAFEYAMEYYEGSMWCVVFVGGALILANVVMFIIWQVRRHKEKAALAPQTAPVSTPVSIPVTQGAAEQVVLERRYSSPIAYVMMVLAGLSLLLGLIIAVEDDIEEGAPLLIIGVLLGVIAFLLLSLKTHLIVTTKRVLVEAPIAYRRNLPLNRIASVSTGMFHYLQITSNAGLAGQIQLFFVPKYLEVYNALGSLLNQVE